MNRGSTAPNPACPGSGFFILCKSVDVQRKNAKEKPAKNAQLHFEPSAFPFVPFAITSSIGKQKGGFTQSRKGKYTQRSPSYTWRPLHFPSWPWREKAVWDYKKVVQRKAAKENTRKERLVIL